MASIPTWGFDTEQAAQTLDKLHKTLTQERVSIKALEAGINSIFELKKQAQQCVDASQKEIDALKSQLPKTKPSEKQNLTDAQNFILEKQNTLKQTQSNCRLFIIRANEDIAKYSEMAKLKKETRIFSKSPPIWHEISEINTRYANWWHSINIQKITHLLVQPITIIWAGIFLVVCILSYAFAKFTNRQAIQWVQTAGQKSAAEITWHNLLLCICHYLTPMLILFIMGLILGCVASMQGTSFSFAYVCLIVLGFVIVHIPLKYYLDPPLGCSTSNTNANGAPQKCFARINYTLLIILVGTVYHTFWQMQIPMDIHHLLSKIFYIFLLTAFVLSLHAGMLAFQVLKQQPILQSITKIFLNFSFVTLIVLLISVYDDFAIYLINGLVFSTGVLIATVFFYRQFINLLEALIFSSSKIKSRLFKFLSINSNDIVFEITILKIVVFLVFWGGFLLGINSIWSLSELWTIHINHSVFSGFELMQTKIIPIKLITGLLCFSLGVLFVKIIRNHFHTQASSKLDATQEAYITILSYVAYVFILILSMLIAGIDIKGLALVAGALSVGIGFGLQNIVNNFVSGLVLLLERPIKKGDRIVVGEKEGYVTHVGIRSTRINTIDNTDVIVPNAELIANKITNFMYNNKYWRNGINIGVAFGSDGKQVEALLIEAANQVDEVVKTGADAPVIYFLKISDSALVFQLWYTHDNVNRKFEVQSELLHAIDTIFKANQIKIAFKQAAIHLQGPVTLPPKPCNSP